ncbi:hypothetical protein, partial [Streptomyces sp. SID3212]|uniref:hypothetical protein n=1 Tax=Streptomyces sp. SID3212 TaxID=2690259 RepID=UPI001F2E06A7
MPSPSAVLPYGVADDPGQRGNDGSRLLQAAASGPALPLYGPPSCARMPAGWGPGTVPAIRSYTVGTA